MGDNLYIEDPYIDLFNRTQHRSEIKEVFLYWRAVYVPLVGRCFVSEVVIVASLISDGLLFTVYRDIVVFGCSSLMTTIISKECPKLKWTFLLFLPRE